MMEYITLLSSIVLFVVSIYGYGKEKGVVYIFWIVSSLSYLALSIALVIMGLDALSLAIAPFLGSIYPSFLAIGIIVVGSRYWKHYFGFVIVMLILLIAQVKCRQL